MKNKVLNTLEIIGFLILLVAVGYMFYNNERLKEIINRQDELIMEAGRKDGEFMKKAENYKDSIKVFTDKISFIVNGKTISSSQFVLLYDRLRDKKDSINNELNKTKRIYDYAKTTYGFDVLYTETDSTYSTSIVPYTKADSAQVALEYFHSRLKRTKAGWSINTTGIEDLKKIINDIKKIPKTIKPAIDSNKTKTQKELNKDSIKN